MFVVAKIYNNLQFPNYFFNFFTHISLNFLSINYFRLSCCKVPHLSHYSQFCGTVNIDRNLNLSTICQNLVLLYSETRATRL